MELDELLGGAPVQHREVEGHESDAFMQCFSSVEYLPGGVASAFRRVQVADEWPRGVSNPRLAASPFAHPRFEPRGWAVALGPSYGAVYTDSDELLAKLLDSATEGGELLWRMPLAPEYVEQIKSPLADIKNLGAPGGGGSITAYARAARVVGWEAERGERESARREGCEADVADATRFASSDAVRLRAACTRAGRSSSRSLWARRARTSCGRTSTLQGPCGTTRREARRATASRRSSGS